MNITNETKLSDIAKEHPWLPAYAKTLDERLGVLDTAVGRILMRRTSVAEAAKLAGVTTEELLDRLDQAIREHGTNASQ